MVFWQTNSGDPASGQAGRNVGFNLGASFKIALDSKGCGKIMVIHIRIDTLSRS